MNSRYSDCVTTHVDYVGSVANTLFLSLKHVFGRIKSLSVYRSTFMLAGKFFFLHEHFIPLQEDASLSQQGRTAAAQRACEVFSIE